MAKHQVIKAGDWIRAHRDGKNNHGFKSGQLVRVVSTDGDEIYAEGEIMRSAQGAGFGGMRFDWGGGRGGMYLYPGEYKYAKQRNKKQGS